MHRLQEEQGEEYRDSLPISMKESCQIRRKLNNDPLPYLHTPNISWHEITAQPIKMLCDDSETQRLMLKISGLAWRPNTSVGTLWIHRGVALGIGFCLLLFYQKIGPLFGELQVGCLLTYSSDSGNNPHQRPPITFEATQHWHIIDPDFYFVSNHVSANTWFDLS